MPLEISFLGTPRDSFNIGAGDPQESRAFNDKREGRPSATLPGGSPTGTSSGYRTAVNPLSESGHLPKGFTRGWGL